jgi:hypothetical protein
VKHQGIRTRLTDRLIVLRLQIAGSLAKALRVTLLWTIALLCASACARSETGVAPHFRLHIIKAGIYTQFGVRDTAGEESGVFDGHPMFGISALGSLRWGRASILGSVTVTGLISYFDKDLGTESASEFRKTGGLTTVRSGVSYSAVRGGRIELEPSLNYCWAWQGARLDLQDRETGEILRPVDYRHPDRGICMGLVFRLWDQTAGSARRDKYGRFRVDYSFADVHDGMHVVDLEYKLVERERIGLYTITQSLFLVGELALSPSVKYVTVGIGTDLL